MTRRDWWLGIAALAAAILFHAMWPRYEWRHVESPTLYSQRFVRIDRWTGAARLGTTRDGGRWEPFPDPEPLHILKSEPLPTEKP